MLNIVIPSACEESCRVLGKMLRSAQHDVHRFVLRLVYGYRDAGIEPDQADPSTPSEMTSFMLPLRKPRRSSVMYE